MFLKAVLMPNWIGDLLLALSVVERKARLENGGLSLIVPEKLAGLVKLLSGLPVILYRRSTFSGYRASLLSVKAFSRFYVLPHSFSSALFAFLSRIPSRRGVSAELRGPLLTERLPFSAASRARHLTYEYAEVLETPAADPSAWKGVSIKKSDEHAGKIVLCPGAAYGPAKQWPHFERLPSLFPGRKFVVLGDAEDGMAGHKVAVSAPLPWTVHNLAGMTSLEEAAAIIAGASAVVSNDSGLLHLAGYLGTPAVGIYGSTSPLWTRPLGSAVRTASGTCPRSPCYERTCPLHHCDCLKSIAPETVAGFVNEIIRSPARISG
jgi:heptosyltransferase-2